jgi:hypothetical protein
MKIAIGTNYYKIYDRQTRALESLYRIRKKYPMVELYNIGFNDHEFLHIDDIKSLPLLTRSSKDIIENCPKKLPFANDMMKALSESGADCCLLINSDIILSPYFIPYIENNFKQAFVCNRFDIDPIEKISDPIKLRRIEIGGFDVWAFSPNWFKTNRKYFEDFLWGGIWFDHHYAGIIKLLANEPICNSMPSYVLHEIHSKNWSYDDPVSKYNGHQLETCKYRDLSKPWDGYFATYLKDKRCNGFELYSSETEKKYEMEFFENAKEKCDKL